MWGDVFPATGTWPLKKSIGVSGILSKGSEDARLRLVGPWLDSILEAGLASGCSIWSAISSSGLGDPMMGVFETLPFSKEGWSGPT